MEIETTLETIGLTKNEVKVYLALLEVGLTSTGKIIKKTGIHTSKVYDALERLAEKGLVSHIIEANTKHFKAVNPDRLLDFMQEKKRKIDSQENNIKDILPDLKLKQQLVGDETEAEIFRGWKGMETVYGMMRKTLKKGDKNYVFGASKGEDEEKVRNFFNRHAIALAKTRIKQKIIFNESARGNIQETLKRPKLNEIRHMQHTTPAEINIWKDKTMIVILRKKPMVILIRDNTVANSFRKYFDVMWALAKR
ncbi:MAG: helix-turn-helix domain-containing protein [Candidatus Woesearchaeota archaeon]|jgi:sugar-specific transcriptional regulator TrmB|nr:helix-turn-helix domain-containing protein [Candidatus Woesearchaeota archaeon]MDP7323679.1 helix-turn-helix domain-containing protein [Candidatus Woesearchaeota archaeon]